MLEGLVPMEHKMELINLLNPTTSKFFAHHFWVFCSVQWFLASFNDLIIVVLVSYNQMDKVFHNWACQQIISGEQFNGMPLTFPQAYADDREFYKKIFALNSTNIANIAIDPIVFQGSTVTFDVDKRNYGFSFNMTNCQITVYNMLDPIKISNTR